MEKFLRSLLLISVLFLPVLAQALSLTHLNNPNENDFPELVQSDTPIRVEKNEFTADLFLGVDTESNVRPVQMAYAPKVGSDSLISSAQLHYQHCYAFGTFSTNYWLDAAEHPSATRYDYITHDFDFPLGLHVGEHQDLVIRPLFGYSTVGASPYRIKAGVALGGVLYRPNYKLTLQGSFYSDHLYVPEIAGEDADHFHFDYTWEFFPPGWFISAQIYVEHARADNSPLYAGISGNFNNAYTESALEFNLQHQWLFFTFGLESKVGVRLDSGDSRYSSPQTGITVRTTRSDFEIRATPSVSVPVYRDVQMVLWYEFDKIASNIGLTDYVDRNSLDQVVGLALKTSVSVF